MFDYAKVSAMRAYHAEGKWPLRIPGLLRGRYEAPAPVPASPTSKLFRAFRPAPAPVAAPAPPPLPYWYAGSLFHSGTRSWEYPWVLDILASLPAGQTVLDVGCGSSEFIFQYVERGLKPLGLDHVRSAQYPESELTPEFVAQWSHAVRFVEGDAANIPLESDSVDAVVCISVMEHVVRRDDPAFHRRCLSEIRRVLRPGGLLVMTCDTFTNPKVAYGGLPGWGEEGWSYRADIEFLDMKPLDRNRTLPSRRDLDLDEDTFFVPPDLYFSMKYGTGFELFGSYHRLTSVGFALVK